MYERNHKLLYSKVRQYLIPAVMMKLALQLGNVVDTMLVGNILGQEALSALGIVIPVLSMVQIPAYFLGNGGAVYAGILLGRRHKQEAEELFTSLFVITILLNLIFFCSSFFVSNSLAHWMCKGSSAEADVASCVFIYLLCSPVFCMGVFLSRFISADSHPKVTSAYYIVSNMVNLILDVVFLEFTDLGVKGTALATVLGFTSGLIVTVFYIRSTRRMLTFSRLRLTAEMLNSTLSAGMPHISYLVVAMVKGFVLNAVVLAFLKENGIVMYTVCSNISLILNMCIGGLMEVIPYTVSILYGEKDFSGIRAVVKRVFRYALPTTCLLMAMILLFPKAFALLFGIRDPETQSTILPVLQIYAVSLPFQMWNYFGIQYYGSVEKSMLATLISLLENGIIMIPSISVGIILSQEGDFSGFTGMAIGFVVSEMFTILLSVLFQKKKYPHNSFLLISLNNDALCHDFTIRSCVEDAVGVAQEIRHFCQSNGIGKGKSNMIAVAAEEMAVNISRYGGRKSWWIDICVSIEEHSEVGEHEIQPSYCITLRLRDNGIPFDPTAYNEEESGMEYAIHGIDVVRNMAQSITYIRAMDLNNTTITI